MIDIRLPHNKWWPRPHQLALWKFLQGGGKRAMAVWHRRAGKDEVLLHHTAVSMMKRPGNYWTCLPEYNQARRAIFTAVNPHTGIRRIDEVFPQELRANTDEGKMFIRFHNGSTYQCIGSDTYNSAVGSSCAGLTMSEAALSNPSAWAYFKPMIEENNGWAAFITTPRGRNHAFEMFKFAQASPTWFSELLTAEDTGALTKQQLDDAREEYKALYGAAQGEQQFLQEYMCDWSSSLLGSFYSEECREVRNDGRIMEIEPTGDVIDWAWDLGVGDDTSLWAFEIQRSGQLKILDFHSDNGHGVEHYRDLIFRRELERGWKHGTDYVPHDAKVLEFGTGKTRVETMLGMGLKPMLVPRASLDDGINAVRRTLPLCLFHPRCEDGFAGLEQYRREWDDDKKCFKPTPLHDWSSNPADAFRYLSQAWRTAPRRELVTPISDGWMIPSPDERRRGGIRL